MWVNIFEYAFDSEYPSDKTYLGHRNSERRCKFCGRTEPDVSFKKDSHIIPAAFGNRTLFSLEECDECNEHLGSPLEDDLAKLLTLQRATARMRSRKGSVKYRPAGKQSHISSGVNSDVVTIQRNVDEAEIQTRQVNDDTLELEVEVPAYRPVNAIKALARMALFVTEIDGQPPIRHVLEWIRGEVEWIPVIYHQIFVPGTGLRQVMLSVYSSNNEALPPFLVMFQFSTAILLLHLPNERWQLPQNLPLPHFNLGDSPYPPPTAQKLTIVRDDVEPKHKETYQIHFSTVVKA